jgi:hypothetical protein
MSCTEKYREYTISIENDDLCDSFEDYFDFDDHIRVLVKLNNGYRDYSYCSINLDETPTIGDKMRPNLSRILGAVGVDSLLQFARDNDDQSVENALLDFIDERCTGDLKVQAHVYDAIGYEAYHGSIHGCSQGDYGEVLIVNKHPTKHPIELDQFEAIKKGIEQFFYEGFFSYSVISPNGEVIDSCCGFLGYDCEESGLLDSARDVIDQHLGPIGDIQPFLDDMVQGYIDALLWVQQWDTIELNVPDSIREKLRADCVSFCSRIGWNTIKPLDAGQLGHDFYLQRHGHGVGFNDRDFYHEVEGFVERAVEIAESFNEHHTYLNLQAE